jgi:hypothetical protein
VVSDHPVLRVRRAGDAEVSEFQVVVSHHNAQFHSSTLVATLIYRAGFCVDYS